MPPGDLELPRTRADVVRQPLVPGQSLVLHLDGRVGKLDASGNPLRTNLYADRRVPYLLLIETMRSGRIPPEFHLISRRELPLTGPDGREALGDLAALLPPPENATPVRVRVLTAVPSTPILAVLDEAPAVRLRWQGRERIVSLGHDEDAAARKAALDDVVGGASEGVPIRILPRPTDHMERIVSIVEALRGRDVELIAVPLTSWGRGSAGSASSPRHR
jgi:hypothetical protein